MSKPAPARYRTTNWSSYNKALRRRGSLLVWLDREMAWFAPKRGRPGRPETFSDPAIQICLGIDVLFGRALRFGRALGKRRTGPPARSRAGAQMLCLRNSGQAHKARHPDRQAAETHVRVALTNRSSAPGTAEVMPTP